MRQWAPLSPSPGLGTDKWPSRHGRPSQDQDKTREALPRSLRLGRGAGKYDKASGEGTSGHLPDDCYARQNADENCLGVLERQAGGLGVQS